MELVLKRYELLRTGPWPHTHCNKPLPNFVSHTRVLQIYHLVYSLLQRTSPATCNPTSVARSPHLHTASHPGHDDNVVGYLQMGPATNFLHVREVGRWCHCMSLSHGCCASCLGATSHMQKHTAECCVSRGSPSKKKAVGLIG